MSEKKLDELLILLEKIESLEKELEKEKREKEEILAIIENNRALRYEAKQRNRDY